jgi:hypothetical protein
MILNNMRRRTKLMDGDTSIGDNKGDFCMFK